SRVRLPWGRRILVGLSGSAPPPLGVNTGLGMAGVACRRAGLTESEQEGCWWGVGLELLWWGPAALCARGRQGERDPCTTWNLFTRGGGGGELCHESDRWLGGLGRGGEDVGRGLGGECVLFAGGAAGRRRNVFGRGEGVHEHDRPLPAV